MRPGRFSPATPRASCPPLPRPAAALSLALLLAGCTNSDARLGVLPVVTPQPDAVVSFSQDVQPIFTHACATSGCHSGTFAPFELSLEDGKAYGNLVGMESAQVPGLLRVNPGDSGTSYLINKLEGTQAPGTSQMPLAQEPLDDSLIKLIRDWIDQGAENN